MIERSFVLFGYGLLGQEIWRNRDRYPGVTIAGVCDNYKDVSTKPLTGWYSGDYLYVVCALSKTPRQEIEACLDVEGVQDERIIHASEFLRRHPDFVDLGKPGNMSLVQAPHPMFWRDMLSEKTQHTIEQSWCRSIAHEDTVSNPDLIYFDHTVYKPLMDENFLDCGAFDGDTVNQFLQASAGRYGSIRAVDASGANCEAYKKRALPAEIIHAALTKGTLWATTDFTGDGPAGHIGDGSVTDTLVPATTIDKLCRSWHPSLIKIDCEGSEADILQGAVETIWRDQPVIACVTYHKPDDIYEIPALLHAINPDYKLFLRKYCTDWFESVVYAVPESRVVCRK